MLDTAYLKILSCNISRQPSARIYLLKPFLLFTNVIGILLLWDMRHVRCQTGSLGRAVTLEVILEYRSLAGIGSSC